MENETPFKEHDRMSFLSLNSQRRNLKKILLLLGIIALTAACQQAKKKRVQTKAKDKVEEVTYIPNFPDPKKSYVRTMQPKISEFFKETMGGKYFNGQFLVAKNGKVIYYKAQGYANYRKKWEITSKTPLHVASVSKVATALAVLRLVDQKKILLDGDVRRYIPDFPYQDITVRMLLNHRSGLQYYGYFTYYTWHLGKTLYNKDILNLLKEHKFRQNFPPNKKFAYCNTNYAILALIVERVTKKPFPQAMKELIFEPLNMKNTFVLDANVDFLKVSQSYKSGWRPVPFDYLDAVYGDKNMYTTAHDLMQMDKGTYSSHFLSDSLRVEMFKGYSYERRGDNNYGLGIRLKEREGKNNYYFHSGWWHGNTAMYSSLRADTVCIIAISNVYSKSPYNTGRLAVKFGNYPLDYPED